MQQMYPGIVNSPSTTLSQTTITVIDPSKFPSAPNEATIGTGEDAETITYTGISGNDITGCIRGFEGIAKAWSNGTSIGRNFTNYDYSSLVSNINTSVQYSTYEGKEFTINNPYSLGGLNHYKGQLHCHTTNSDGADTPTALVTAYKNAGYDFITITDHNVITTDPEVSGILWIGASCEETQEKHINAYDITVRDTVDTNAQDIINFHKNNNKMTSLAHPNWNMDGYSVAKSLSKEEIIKLFDYNFMEVFNSVTNTSAEIIWDWALSSGKKVFALAVDDCHNISSVSTITGLPQFNVGYVIVFADVLNTDSIKFSLRSGNFYASTGNDITVSIVEDTIIVTSSTSSNFTFIGRNGRVLKTNNGVTSTSYEILGDEMYVRVKSVKVSDSTIAWSQPIFVDCIGDDSRPIADLINLSKCYYMPLINGDFEVCQRGTIFTNPFGYTFDRFAVAISNISTLPTIIHSKQQLTSGEIYGSFSFYRINTNNAGSGIGTNASYCIYHRIKQAVRLFCGLGKKITLTFYARSSIVNKKLGIGFSQRYGTGSSPSANETIPGITITLTSIWTKYSITVDTNTLVGKVFGTNNDDFFQFRFDFAWDSVYGGSVGYTGTSDFGGEGNVDIARLRFFEGSTELSTPSKNIKNEISDCQEYCYAIDPLTEFRMVNYTANDIYFWIPAPVAMRIAPTPVFGTETTDWQVLTTAGVAQTGFTVSSASASNRYGVLLKATKTAHGLTDATLKTVTAVNRLDAEL